MKKPFLTAAVTLGMALMFTACSGNTSGDSSGNIADTQIGNHTNGAMIEPADKFEDHRDTGEQTEMKMNVQIGDYSFTATLENNAAVDELLGMMKEEPVTIQMDDYSGFEKVGSLGKSLTTSNSQITTSAGDIVLYNGNNIVMFYGSNTWSYTKIGKIEDLSEWKKALGDGSITAVLRLRNKKGSIEK